MDKPTILNPNDLVFRKTTGDLYYNEETKILQIEHPEDYNEQGCSPVWLYNAKCLSINEFRKIIKMVTV